MRQYYNFIEFTTTRQCHTNRILSDDCFNSLQNHLHWGQIDFVISSLARQNYNCNVTINRAKVWKESMRNKLIDFGLFKLADAYDKDFNVCSDRSNRRYIGQVKDFINYKQSRLDESLDLAVSVFKNLIQTNDSFRTQALDILQGDYVTQHNAAIIKMKNDIHYGIPNAIMTITSNITQRNFRLFRSIVCYIIWSYNISFHVFFNCCVCCSHVWKVNKYM